MFLLLLASLALIGTVDANQDQLRAEMSSWQPCPNNHQWSMQNHRCESCPGGTYFIRFEGIVGACLPENEQIFEGGWNYKTIYMLIQFIQNNGGYERALSPIFCDGLSDCHVCDGVIYKSTEACPTVAVNVNRNLCPLPKEQVFDFTRKECLTVSPATGVTCMRDPEGYCVATDYANCVLFDSYGRCTKSK
ncbi:hypothetical protein PRIPAC_86466 [Pristionchus pacificus]|uniref:Uncharacterized protein n=1 Tax=Pristionchus pacificus TaxID=54126 RepID=A0A2A6CEZ6_PRIPA|nr:hypothetical protein PRIPAC_86466 [Pristionchus pacificus]|eukprot:PDM76581.1 hypothetical protein PRIPAC_42947 [Pristionchus pacificus]